MIKQCEKYIEPRIARSVAVAKKADRTAYTRCGIAAKPNCRNTVPGVAMVT